MLQHRLKLEDEGRVLYRAMTAVNDEFIFEAISLFQDDEDENEIQKEQEGESELDANSVFIK